MLAAIVFVVADVLFLRTEAGSRPGGRGTFLCFAKETYPKERRPSVCGPFGANLGRGACGVRRITHCAPAALRSDKRGESVHEACALRRACHPASTPPQAQPEGGGQPNSPTAQQPNSPTATRAVAALGPDGRRRFAPRSARPSAAMARRDVRLRDPFRMRRGAQRPADQGSRLSERRRREFERDPAGREHRRLPAAKRRDAACRVAFLLGTFLWRSKEKYLARRGETRPPP